MLSKIKQKFLIHMVISTSKQKNNFFKFTFDVLFLHPSTVRRITNLNIHDSNRTKETDKAFPHTNADYV